MASKLKNLRRSQIDQSTEEKSSDSSLQNDLRSPNTKEDGDDFPVAPNVSFIYFFSENQLFLFQIAAKIAQRRLPRRTPTSHVKGVGGDLIRRRLSKTNDESATNRPDRCTNSFEKSFDESDVEMKEVSVKTSDTKEKKNQFLPSKKEVLQNNPNKK
uniref:Uncharacterized protein n=1 Tax=Caenorhabditis tropicalis TaxID=1561998 RepID=A0A1I7UVV3_9PELO